MGTQPPPQKKTGGWHSIPPLFGPCLLWPNGWMDQYATWYEGMSRSRPHCVRWGPSSPSPKKGTAPNFRPMSIVAKRSPISATVEQSFPLIFRSAICLTANLSADIYSYIVSWRAGAIGQQSTAAGSIQGVARCQAATLYTCRQVVHTRVPLFIKQHRLIPSKGGDALKLGR